MVHNGKRPLFEKGPNVSVGSQYMVRHRRAYTFSTH